MLGAIDVRRLLLLLLLLVVLEDAAGVDEEFEAEVDCCFNMGVPVAECLCSVACGLEAVDAGLNNALVESVNESSLWLVVLVVSVFSLSMERDSNAGARLLRCCGGGGGAGAATTGVGRGAAAGTAAGGATEEARCE